MFIFFRLALGRLDRVTSRRLPCLRSLRRVFKWCVVFVWIFNLVKLPIHQTWARHATHIHASFMSFSQCPTTNVEWLFHLQEAVVYRWEYWTWTLFQLLLQVKKLFLTACPYWCHSFIPWEVVFSTRHHIDIIMCGIKTKNLFSVLLHLCIVCDKLLCRWQHHWSTSNIQEHQDFKQKNS